MCLAAALRWQRLGDARLLALAAAAAGVSFSFKHNTGLLALAALAVGVVLARDRLSARALGGAVAALVVSIALPLLPVLVQGGGPKLFEYGVIAKTSYVDLAAISYWDGLERGVSGPDVRHLYFVLPLIVVPLLALVVARPGPLPRTAAATTAAFVLAALANAWPLVDLYHLLTAAPLLLLGLWMGAHVLLRDRARRVAERVAAVAVGGALVFLLSAAVLHWARDDWEPSDIPHLRGALMPPDSQSDVRRRAAALGAAARTGGPVLILAPDAALRHLISGTPNSTRWDYPLVTTFGPSGEEELREAIEKRRFAAVCIVTSHDDPLRPLALEAAVRKMLRPAEDGVGCTMYRQTAR